MRSALLILALASCTSRLPPAPPVEAATEAQVHIRKSPLDGRAYRYLELDNGLRALLISDPDTDMASAALSVHVGHYADPQDRQGLAHFLEHMLFMGTDAYPAPDEYRKFVQDHGGRTNAGTGGESTTYHFQVEHPYLDPAFDRFARFFVAPVLDPGYVDRERNAVHSEYSLKLTDHARRVRQVRKITTNPAHPESKFSVGNLVTLADRDDATVHADLLALYERTYRPDQMTLAILGREPVDELASWVEARLGQVPVRPDPTDERPPPFADDQLGVRIDMIPLDERRELELQFPLPPEQAVWPRRPADFIAGALGHEGEDTLFDRLKRRGWITSLSASAAADGADDHDLFSLSYDLTPEGAAHIDDVIAASFAAIALLRDEGVEAWRHQERRQMAALDFAWSEEANPVQATRGGVWSLYYHPPEHVLDHATVAAPFDPAPIHEALANLIPSNLRVLVVLPDGESGEATDLIEPLYDVAYGIRPLTGREQAAFVAGTDLDIALPGPNPYLPEVTALKPGGEAPGVPTRSAAAVELWHLHDTSFGVPRAVGALQLYSPAPREHGVRTLVLHELFEELLDDDLQALRYPLGRAGIGFSVTADDEGLAAQLWGYDDRQDQLLGDLATRLRAFRVDPERFDLIRGEQVRAWRNLEQRRPIDQAHQAMSEALDPWRYEAHAAIPIAEALTVEDMQAYVDGFWRSLSARLFVHGNHTADDAAALARVVEQTLLAGAAPAPPVVAQRRLLPPGQVVRDLEVDHDDSSLMIAYVGLDDSLSTEARWRLLAQLLGTPFFNQLRTEQQLGYVVGSWFSTEDRLPGLKMRIQSPVAGPVTLLDRVDTFLADAYEAVRQMPDHELATIRAGVVARLLEAETQLYGRTGELRSDLRAGVLTFDHDAQVAALVEALDRDTMADFFAQVLLSDDSGRLVVRSFGRAHAHEREQTTPGCPDQACVAEALPALYERSLTDLSPPER